MAEPAAHVRRVDLTDPAALHDYLAMLDAYAADPMGAGRPLPRDVIERLADDLPRHPTAVCLLADVGDTTVGFATCFLGYSTFRARPLLNVHDIAVASAWRGRGIGRQLLCAIEHSARLLGCCALTLEVRDDNPAAQSLYADYGFAAATCGRFMEKTLS